MQDEVDKIVFSLSELIDTMAADAGKKPYSPADQVIVLGYIQSLLIQLYAAKMRIAGGLFAPSSIRAEL